MRRETTSLQFFGGAGAAAGENGGAGTAENGAGPAGNTAEAAGGTAGPSKNGTEAAGEAAGQSEAAAGTAGGPEEEATGSVAAAEADGGKQGAASGADGQPDAEEADDGSLLRKAMAAARLKAAAQTARRWEKEAEALKAVYPGFSLEQALRGDAGFTALLKAGAPVKLAYEAAHLEEIMGAAMRYAARDARRRTAESMAADGRRARENPVLDRAASVTRKDVASMTEKEIMKILRQVSNGEKVVF